MHETLLYRSMWFIWVVLKREDLTAKDAALKKGGVRLEDEGCCQYLLSLWMFGPQLWLAAFWRGTLSKKSHELPGKFFPPKSAES